MFLAYLQASPLLRQYALEFMYWYGCTTPVAGSTFPYALRRRAERRRSIAGRHGMGVHTNQRALLDFNHFDNMEAMTSFVISGRMSYHHFIQARVIVKSMVVASRAAGRAFTDVVKSVMDNNHRWCDWDQL